MKTSYIKPAAYDLAVNRIVPIPKQVESAQGAVAGPDLQIQYQRRVQVC